MELTNTEFAACTIIAKNYLPMARVLTESWHRFHPDCPMFVLMLDSPAGFATLEKEAFESLSLNQLEIPHVYSLQFKYPLLELGTAVKPYLLNYLFQRYAPRKLLYLDADILILASLHKLRLALDQANVLLTPHLLAPNPDDKQHSDDLDILQTGVYNLGFLGLRNSFESQQLLSWWSKKLYHHCIDDRPGNLFVDQRWMDLVPGLYDGVQILRDPGYNVARWNLHERAVSTDGDSFKVDGGPLFFFHFSGFNPDQPWIVSKHWFRYDIAGIGQARKLYLLYRDLVMQKGWDETRNWPYDHDYFANGMRISASMRRRYWELGPDVSYLGDPFLWLGVGARSRTGMEEEEPSSRLAAGINILSSVDPGEASEDSEGSLRTITAAELSYAIQSTTGDRARLKEALSRHSAEENSYNTNLFLLPADMFQWFARDKSSSLAGRFNIAYLDWPGSCFPKQWATIFGDVDEVWTPSEYVRRAVTASCPVPERVIYPSIDPSMGAAPESDATADGSSDVFSFVFAFDLRSCFERKFPLGLMKAFQSAFGDRRDVELLIYCSNALQARKRLLEMQRAVAGANIKLRNDPLTSITKHRLLMNADCYVSLHRAEAFGLTLAEAMACAKPVIATGYSGNLDFMSDQDSFLVPYRMVEIKGNRGAYTAGQYWAEPDQDYAVDMMRYVESNRECAAEVGASGGKKVREMLDSARTGGAVHLRLSELGLL